MPKLPKTAQNSNKIKAHSLFQTKLMTDSHPDILDNNETVHYCITKADTGATNRYWRKKDISILENVTEKRGPPVQLPNSEVIHSTARGVIPLSLELSNDAKETMILPKLTSSNLISLGQLYDDDCEILLNKNEMRVIKTTRLYSRDTETQKMAYGIFLSQKPLSHRNAVKPPSHILQSTPVELKNTIENRKIDIFY